MKLNRTNVPWAHGWRTTGFANACGLAALLACSPASAVFDASVSPPRFELSAKPGEIVRQVVKINNGSVQPARYGVKTADWELEAKGGVRYYEGVPRADSCRPWVRLERHLISVGPKDNRNYRFEVHVPADAKPGECRFALLLSSEAALVAPPGGDRSIQIPVVGRIGVIVYVTVGGAKPELKLVGIETRKVDGRTMPVASFRNSGNAHGRVFGNLEAKDSKGRRVELVAEQAVLLPDASREIRLSPIDWSSGEAREPTFDLVPPMHVRGKLQFLGGGEVSIDQVIR